MPSSSVSNWEDAAAPRRPSKSQPRFLCRAPRVNAPVLTPRVEWIFKYRTFRVTPSGFAKGESNRSKSRPLGAACGDHTTVLRPEQMSGAHGPGVSVILPRGVSQSLDHRRLPQRPAAPRLPPRPSPAAAAQSPIDR